MEPEKGLELSDAPGFTIPVFSRRAWECLEPLISKNVEILPLDFNEKEYFGINVITVLDAIDYENQFIKPIGMVKELWHLKSMFFCQP